MEDWICMRCQYLRQKEIEGQWTRDEYGYRKYVSGHYAYFCTKKLKYTVSLDKKCKHYMPLTQTKMRTGDNSMVKIDEIPSEGARIDLSELPPEADLIIVKESIKEETVGKTGGLVITYQLKDGRTFQQKYSKVSGAELIQALKKLKYTSTEPLTKEYHHYKLTHMRIGFPRMIPIAKTKEEKQ